MNISTIHLNQKTLAPQRDLKCGTVSTSVKDVNNNENDTTAVIISLSDEGVQKAQQNQLEAHGGTYAKTLQDLMEQAKSGEVLSPEETERLDKELKRMTEEQYESMDQFRLADNDERVLKALKNHFLMRQRTLADMEKQIESDKASKDVEEQQAQTAQDSQKISDKNSEIRMLQESLNQDHNSNDKKSDTTQDNNNFDSQKKQNVSDKNDNGTAIISVTQKQDEKIEELSGQKKEEATKMHAVSTQLDQAYERAKSVLEENEFTIKDRVEAYEKFKDSSYALAVEREIARHETLYDHQSVVDAKILRAGNKIKNSDAFIHEKVARAGQEYLLDM